MSLQLPDEVQKFKKFVQDRDGIVEEVRSGKYTWQQLFDIWRHDGDDDQFWDRYELKTASSNSSKNDYMKKLSNVFDTISKIDFEQLEKQVNNLSKTIDQVQKFLKETKGQNQVNQPSQNPFSQNQGQNPFSNHNQFF
ncbi:spore coat protein YlbD [Tenuibacillus multivorans]|uniref:Putative coat protein n=1 Tax=Tenuibacillus multivorans TaxID=237069 RepID=A0A1G9YAK6_9BACI|nr:spore coat protein YlbD [Tenuibacillus multivorans]GEL75997.1 hypothetical protein TMU01_02320 [Tenuibacillus multivorans]SDN05545.1 Putative coat protein [Tenuibacillus multivorans]